MHTQRKILDSLVLTKGYRLTRDQIINKTALPRTTAVDALAYLSGVGVLHKEAELTVQPSSWLILMEARAGRKAVENYNAILDQAEFSALSDIRSKEGITGRQLSEEEKRQVKTEYMNRAFPHLIKKSKGGRKMLDAKAWGRRNLLRETEYYTLTCYPSLLRLQILIQESAKKWYQENSQKPYWKRASQLILKKMEPRRLKIEKKIEDAMRKGDVLTAIHLEMFGE